MAGPTNEDDISPEDAEAFEALTPDDIKQIERFRKWQEKQKTKADAPKDQKIENPDLSKNSLGDMSGLTLGQLQAIAKTPKSIRSILRSLLDEADQSDNDAAKPKPKKPFALITGSKTKLL